MSVVDEPANAPVARDKEVLLNLAIQHCIEQFGCRPNQMDPERRERFHVELGIIANFIQSKL